MLQWRARQDVGLVDAFPCIPLYYYYYFLLADEKVVYLNDLKLLANWQRPTC